MKGRWDSEAERALLADTCLKSFWFFARFAFGAELHPDGGWLNDYHRQLCNMIQSQVERWEAILGSDTDDEVKILIVAHRGSGKTVLVTKALPMWLHLRNPNIAVVIDSEKMEKAKAFMAVPKRIWEGKDETSLFCWLYGIWAQADDWTMERVTHRVRTANLTEPSLACGSVETGITGYHPHALVTDDPLTQEKLNEGGKAVENANTHMDAVTPALKTDSLQVLVGTPYVDGDPITSALLDEGVSAVHGLPLPPDYEHALRPDGLWTLFWLPGRTEDGARTVPKAWKSGKMARWEKKKPADFAAQVMLVPGSGDHSPLTYEQLQDMYVDSKDVSFHLLRYFIHMDTAFKSAERVGKGDESVILVFGHHPDTGDVYYIEGYGSNKWREEDFVDKLIWVVQKLRRRGRRISYMTDEKVLGGKQGIWPKLLQSYFHGQNMYRPPLLTIQRSTRRNAKIHRIIEAAGYWVDGHVHLLRGAPGVERLIDQQARILVTRKKDWMDAAADTFHPDIYRPMRRTPRDEQPQKSRRPLYDIVREQARAGSYAANRQPPSREPIR